MKYISNILSNFFDVLKTFSFFDVLDILIIAFLIFCFIKLVKETRAAQLVKGVLVLLIVWFLAAQLHLKMLSSLLNNLFSFGVLAMLIIFQPEIRRALEHLGKANIDNVFENESTSDKIYNAINEVCKSCFLFSESKTGALIVFERNTKLKEISDTGTYINANVSTELIGNIFFNKAPLHDGAMIIRDGSILAAGCILPLTKSNIFSSNLGTRHRAAIGISENSDAVVLIVSEETGVISIALNGVIKRRYSEQNLKQELIRLLTKDEKHRKIYTVTKKYRKIKHQENKNEK